VTYTIDNLSRLTKVSAGSSFVNVGYDNSIAANGLGFWVYSGEIHNSFIAFPTHPDPSTLRTVPFEIKGRIVYVSQQDLSTYYYSIGAAAIFMALYCILFYLNKKNRKSNQS
jgi:hypothetical protein